MSCLNSTSPIDIDPQKQSGTCDLKCNYQFKYRDFLTTAVNRGDHISLRPKSIADNATAVRFNSQNYAVSEMRLYSPSLHSFRGKKSRAELIIVHTSESGNHPLLVCIPVLGGGLGSSSSSQYISKLIKTMSKTAPTDGDTTDIDNPHLNLNDFVPIGEPFFSYTGTQPYQPCQGRNYYVVFEPRTSACGIDDANFETLMSIIEANAYNTVSGTRFFLNKDGAQNGFASEDDIYIDCQPVGESEETTETLHSTSGSGSGSSSQKNSEWLKPLLVCILFFVIIIVFKYVLKSAGGWFSKIKKK